VAEVVMHAFRDGEGLEKAFLLSFRGEDLQLLAEFGMEKCIIFAIQVFLLSTIGEKVVKLDGFLLFLFLEILLSFDGGLMFELRPHKISQRDIVDLTPPPSLLHNGFD
jgi:hypothetical protein